MPILIHLLFATTTFAGVITEDKAPLLRASSSGGSEGPAWDGKGNLYFTGQGRIFKLDSEGVTHTYREQSGGANGLLIDSNGNLYACEATNRRVTKTSPDGTVSILADSYQGKRFNSPNDLTLDAKGRIWFTDPRYGSREGMELEAEGVYRIDSPGKVTRVLGPDQVNRPNGILITTDQRHLYVADNNNNTPGGARKLWRFSLKSDGTVQPNSRKLIYDWGDSRGPDGIEMDQKGRLFVAGGLNQPHPPYETNTKKGGVYVLSPEGQLLEFIPVPNDEVTNVAFGGKDLKTLYISAGGVIFSIRVKSPGVTALR